MNTFSPTPSHHPLVDLVPLIMLADEWRTRDTRRGTTWAGLWQTRHRAVVQQLVHQHLQPLDPAMLRRLMAAGRLPGARDVAHLIGLLVHAPACGDAHAAGADDGNTEDEDLPSGIPLYDHGVFDQAKIVDVRHAVHLVRHLDDFHEPTAAAIRRRVLRKLADPDDVEQRRDATSAAAELFLDQPTRWRDVVESAVLLRTVRAIEAVLGHRLRGPRRTPAELLELAHDGLAALREQDAHADAQTMETTLERRLARLRAAQVVLMYEEQRYLQLTGVVVGRSVRRHVPRGVHLIFSDQRHRRDDRSAGLWLEASEDDLQAGPYYFAPEAPPAYAAKKRTASLRVPDADALRRYLEHDLA